MTRGRLRACSELQMFQSTFLAPSHYAGKWVIPEEDQHYDPAAVNAVGYAYATAPDSPAKKERSEAPQGDGVFSTDI
jgi:hypothetical protein